MTSGRGGGAPARVWVTQRGGELQEDGEASVGVERRRHHLGRDEGRRAEARGDLPIQIERARGRGGSGGVGCGGLGLLEWEGIRRQQGRPACGGWPSGPAGLRPGGKKGGFLFYNFISLIFYQKDSYCFG